MDPDKPLAEFIESILIIFALIAAAGIGFFALVIWRFLL